MAYILMWLAAFVCVYAVENQNRKRFLKETHCAKVKSQKKKKNIPISISLSRCSVHVHMYVWVWEVKLSQYKFDYCKVADRAWVWGWERSSKRVRSGNLLFVRFVPQIHRYLDTFTNGCTCVLLVGKRCQASGYKFFFA